MTTVKTFHKKNNLKKAVVNKTILTTLYTRKLNGYTNTQPLHNQHGNYPIKGIAHPKIKTFVWLNTKKDLLSYIPQNISFCV